MTYYQILEIISKELERKIDDIIVLMQGHLEKLRYIYVYNGKIEQNYGAISKDVYAVFEKVLDNNAIEMILGSLKNIKKFFAEDNVVSYNRFYEKYITDDSSKYNLEKIRNNLLDIPNIALEMSENGEKDEIILDSIKENVSRVVDEVFNTLETDIQKLLNGKEIA